MSKLNDLWRLWDIPSLSLTWADRNEIGSQTWQWAETQRWLQEGKPSQVLPCPECQNASELVKSKSKDGQIAAHIKCDSCGLQKVSLDSLRQWRLNHANIAQSICLSFERAPAVTELLPDQVWELGNLILPKKRPRLILVRSLPFLLKTQAQEILILCRNGIVITPTRVSAAKWSGVSFSLEEWSQWEEGRVSVKVGWKEILKAAFEETTVVKRVVAKRRSKIALKSERVSKFLEDHIQRLKENAQSTFEASNASGLLPLLKKKDIADALGLEPYEITRCFKGDNGRGLRRLWKVIQTSDVRDIYRHRQRNNIRYSDLQKQQSLQDQVIDMPGE